MENNNKRKKKKNSERQCEKEEKTKHHQQGISNEKLAKREEKHKEKCIACLNVLIT